MHKNPKNNFNVSFSTSTTRSCGSKSRHNTCTTNKEHHFYFNRISHLWNSVPIIDLNLPFTTIKQHIKSYFWKHFVANFHSDDLTPFVHVAHAHLSIFQLTMTISNLNTNWLMSVINCSSKFLIYVFIHMFSWSWALVAHGHGHLLPMVMGTCCP